MVPHLGLRDYSCFLREKFSLTVHDVSILTIPSEQREARSSPPVLRQRCLHTPRPLRMLVATRLPPADLPPPCPSCRSQL